MAKRESTKAEVVEQDVPQITGVAKCTLPGFEQVTIVFDLMATPAQVDNFVRMLGASGSHRGVVVEVDNWLADEYGPDPFDVKRVPGVWLAWLARKGWGKAMRAYLDDPNS